MPIACTKSSWVGTIVYIKEPSTSGICEVNFCLKKTIVANTLDTRALKNKGQYLVFKHDNNQRRKKHEWIKIKVFLQKSQKVEKRLNLLLDKF